MTQVPFMRLYVLLSAVAFAQPTPPEGDGPKVEETPRPASLGLWPSPQFVDLMLRRWANDVSVQYDLDERQRDKVTEAVSSPGLTMAIPIRSSGAKERRGKMSVLEPSTAPNNNDRQAAESS